MSFRSSSPRFWKTTKISSTTSKNPSNRKNKMRVKIANPSFLSTKSLKTSALPSSTPFLSHPNARSSKGISWIISLPRASFRTASTTIQEQDYWRKVSTLTWTPTRQSLRRDTGATSIFPPWVAGTTRIQASPWAGTNHLTTLSKSPEEPCPAWQSTHPKSKSMIAPYAMIPYRTIRSSKYYSRAITTSITTASISGLLSRRNVRCAWIS